MPVKTRRIKIYDTTLRDGEQAPGCSMNLNEKRKIAASLELLGVDTIEAGFAIVSEGDFEAVRTIAKQVRGCAVASLARALKKDIDIAYEAVKPSVSPHINIFIATSEIHMQYKLKMSPDEVLGRIEQSVSYAKTLCPSVEFSAEDATRSDWEFLKTAFSTALNAGATCINVADTVGYSTPEEMIALVHYLCEQLPELSEYDLGVHCHNDLGMAVANSLAGLKAGAQQVDCTLSGIGERAGNTALEEIAMAIKTRESILGLNTGINTHEIYRSATKLARILGMSIPANKAIIGANAFSHESGIHQHGVMENPSTYELIHPEDVGVIKNVMVLGKHSGRHAFEERLLSLGITPPEGSMDELFDRFKALADKKKEISDFDLIALAENRSQTFEYYKLDRFVINSGNTIKPTAIVRLQTHEGKLVESVAYGDGPIYASYWAIDRITKLKPHLDGYLINSVTQGGDALGQVSVKVTYQGRTVTGRGLSTDVLESSIIAYIHAVNKIMTIFGETNDNDEIIIGEET